MRVSDGESDRSRTWKKKTPHQTTHLRKRDVLAAHLTRQHARKQFTAMCMSMPCLWHAVADILPSAGVRGPGQYPPWKKKTPHAFPTIRLNRKVGIRPFNADVHRCTRVPVIQARAHWPTLNGRMPTLRCACCQPNVAFFSSMCGLRLIEMNFDMCAGSMWRWRPTRDSRRGSHLETIRGTRHLGAIRGTHVDAKRDATRHPSRRDTRHTSSGRDQRHP